MGNENNIKLNSMLRKGTMLHGTYRIDSYLSSGGFGNTYVATHINFKKQYAVKEFFIDGVSERAGDNTTVIVSNASRETEFNDQRAKFYKEAQRLHGLSNRHIVRVHDLFDENGTTYYVMDYIDGENLRERLKRTGQPMSEKEVEDVLLQVLDALDEVHSQGLYHMDICPANILVDHNGVVKLIDFGASKQFNTNRGGALPTSAVTYTNGYAPREQMEGNHQKFGPWTDFYALGATLYYLLSKQKPPMPSDVDDDLTPDKHLALSRPVGVSDHMWDLVRWLMKPRCTDRPQSVSDIMTDLNRGGNYVDVGTDNTGSNKTRLRLGNDTPSIGNPTIGQKSKRNIMWFFIAFCAGLVIGAVACYFYRGPLLRDITETNSNRNDSIILCELEANMVQIKGGTFYMGATSEQISDADSLEYPAHKVTLSDFRICKYEVTQELWQVVMGKSIKEQRNLSNLPSSYGFYGEGADYPMYYISWDDCQEFIARLNEKTGKHYRLPTEAEWEFAARGGTPPQGYKYAGNKEIKSVAWYSGNSGSVTHPVGKKLPNILGLYDMSGNVSEWCKDWCGKYSEGAVQDPSGPLGGTKRVIRGGNMSYNSRDCRVSYRGYKSQSERDYCIGLRLAL